MINEILNILRIVFGSVYILFVPGFVLSFAFFRKGKIDAIERIALSFALSIAVVPLIVFYLNLLGVKINTLSVFLEVLGICLVAGAYLFAKMKYESRNHEHKS